MIQYLDETRITAIRETPVPRHKRRQDGYGTLVPGAFMLQLDGKRLELGVHLLAWLTPLREKIDKDGQLAAQDPRFELVFGNHREGHAGVLNVAGGSCHGGASECTAFHQQFGHGLSAVCSGIDRAPCPQLHDVEVMSVELHDGTGGGV